METARGLRAWFPRPRSANEVGLLVAVSLFGAYQYLDRALLSYLQYWCNLAIAGLITLLALIYLALRRAIRWRQPLYALALLGGLCLAQLLPLPVRPDVRAFVRGQADYVRLLQLATSDQLAPDTSLAEDELASAPTGSRVLVAPPAFAPLHANRVVIEQASPLIVGFASTRYLATVYYLETPAVVELLRARVAPAGFALLQMRGEWWLVWH